DFKRHFGFAREGQRFAAKIRRRSLRQGSAQKQFRRATQQRSKTHFRKHASFQQAIAHIGRRENPELAAVKAAIANEREFTDFFFFSIGDFDFDLALRKRSQTRNDISERTDFFLQSPV